MSKIEVNAIEPQSGTTLTLGASGDTVALAAGASSSGFGRSGTVNWDTTAKTTGFTAVSGNGYFCNTTSAAFTVTLPATPSAGDIVAIADYANTAATNNITVGRNGSKIDGETIDAKIKINGQVYTLVYVDSTEGWKTVYQTYNQITTVEFVAATGGTITTCGNYKIHTFTGPGTFTVTNAGNPAGSSTVDYMVVAGGASGGTGDVSGGGGAGGFRESVPSPAAWTASPLANPGGALPVSVTGYPITVGAGGASTGPADAQGNPGSNSIFSTITSTGGGGGANGAGASGASGTPGGSGGGANYTGPSTGGTGNSPPTSPPQGSNGGLGNQNPPAFGGGGGGGATAVGGTGTSSIGGAGGAGATTSISGSPTSYAGGGGGARNDPGTLASGGTGGGGAGGSASVNGSAGTVNTGGGGGGADNFSNVSGAGGSGIVIIRYKFQ
jgi:hypothetical protein